MEEEGDKLYEEQAGGEIHLAEEELRGVQGETQMQWMWIGEQRGIECAMYAENGTIWPRIAGKGRTGREG